MKKFILKLILFFSLIVIIDISVGVLGDYFQAHARSGDTGRVNDLVMKDRHDVVILGSSRAHHHYDTPFMSESLNMDVYNAGFDGNGVVLSYGLLSLLLERYNPKLILFDVEPAFDINVYEPDNHHIRYINSLKPYYRHKDVGELIRSVSSEEWYKVHSGMMRYNSNFTSIVLDNLHSHIDSSCGYEPLMEVYSEVVDYSTKEEKIDPFKLDYIEKLIALAESNHVPIVFVASPKLGVRNSGDLQPIMHICSNHNVPFFDYYTDSTFVKNKQWFNEPMHLNADGARRFSEIMVDRIKEQISN